MYGDDTIGYTTTQCYHLNLYPHVHGRVIGEGEEVGEGGGAGVPCTSTTSLCRISVSVSFSSSPSLDDLCDLSTDLRLGNRFPW